MACWSQLTLYTFLHLWVISAAAQSQPLPLELERNEPHANLVSMDERGHMLARRGRFVEAASPLRVSPDAQQKVLPLPFELDEGKTLHREAPEIRIRLHEPEPPHDVIVLNSLAEIFRYSDLDIEVTVMQIQALYPIDTIWTLSTLRKRTLVTRHNRATILGVLRHPEQAVEILREVVQEHEDLQAEGINSEEGFDYATMRLDAMENLASNLARMGRADEAVELFHRVAKEATDPRRKGRVLISSGHEFNNLGKLKEAGDAITEGLKLRLTAGPVCEPDKKRYVDEIKDVLRKQDRIQEAEDLNIDTLAVDQKQ